MNKRSYKKIDSEDLEKLRGLAERERLAFFHRNPQYSPFKDLHIATALCQGAALHYLDHKNGIKDFDIWFFYAEHPTLRYPYRARKQVDSKLKKFGRGPQDIEWGFKGRRVDLMGREIDSDIIKRNNHDPVKCIQEYLKRARTESARHLAKKAVIGLHPENITGTIIWDVV